jgi:hypothetical protein
MAGWNGKCLPAQSDGGSLRRCTIYKAEAWWLILTFQSLAAALCTFTHKIKLDRQCTHNIIHWGAFVQQLLPWKSNNYYIFWMCVCSLRYPAWNSHAPCCHLWPLWLYNIFPHYLMNGRIFLKPLLNIKWVFFFDFIYKFGLKDFLL